MKHVPAHVEYPLPRWIAMWFLLTLPIMLWDAGFILCRPTSLPGGSLGWLWSAYQHYIAVDHRYANPSDFITVAFTWVNLFDVLLALVVCYYYFKHNKKAVLWAFSAAGVTWTKTILYFALEIASGRQATGHASTLSFIFLFVLLNGLWLLVPGLILWSTGKRLAQSLQR